LLAAFQRHAADASADARHDASRLLLLPRYIFAARCRRAPLKSEACYARLPLALPLRQLEAPLKSATLRC